MSSNLLMSVLCLNVRRLCVPNIMSLGICFIEKIAPHQSWRVCLIVYSVKISVIFGVRFERRKVDRKSKPTQKLKHANSILESFEYFCQMLSKLIFIMLSYNVSKFARFLWDTVYSGLCAKNEWHTLLSAEMLRVTSFNGDLTVFDESDHSTKVWLQYFLYILLSAGRQ